MRAAGFEARFGNVDPYFFTASKRLMLTLVLALFVWVGCQAQPERSTLPSPIRAATIYVQVSLPNGRPAGGALVTLRPTRGAPSIGFANDSGRLEFPGMPEVQYSVTATSPSDPNLVSDAVEMNPSLAANGNLTVQLLLRDRSDHTKSPKSGVIRAGENEQKIPKEARKAFNEGLKFR